MDQAQSVLLALAITAILLATLGRRLPIPTAIIQVLGESMVNDGSALILYPRGRVGAWARGRVGA